VAKLILLCFNFEVVVLPFTQAPFLYFAKDISFKKF